MPPTQDQIEREFERFESGTQLLEDVIARLSDEELRARPIAGKWSMLECTAHLADFEPILAYRMKCMLTFDGPELVGLDESRYALSYQRRDIATELSIFRDTRAQLLVILRDLPREALMRTGRHSELGRVSVFSYLKAASGHLEHHMQHMNDKRLAFGLEAVDCPPSSDYPARGV